MSSNHRCCAERRLLDSWVDAARRHGVPPHKVVPWVRRKLGPSVVVLRFRGDGTLGCSVPCVLCQRELTRFDLQVHCYLGAEASGGAQWFTGRLSDEGAPAPVLTAGQRRTLNLDPGPKRLKKKAAAAAEAAAQQERSGHPRRRHGRSQASPPPRPDSDSTRNARNAGKRQPAPR